LSFELAAEHFHVFRHVRFVLTNSIPEPAAIRPYSGSAASPSTAIPSALPGGAFAERLVSLRR
jgi:hypothetical protein